MSGLDEKYLEELKLQMKELENKFNFHAKHNATFDELKSILTLMREIKEQIKEIEKRTN